MGQRAPRGAQGKARSESQRAQRRRGRLDGGEGLELLLERTDDEEWLLAGLRFFFLVAFSQAFSMCGFPRVESSSSSIDFKRRGRWGSDGIEIGSEVPSTGWQGVANSLWSTHATDGGSGGLNCCRSLLHSSWRYTFGLRHHSAWCSKRVRTSSACQGPSWMSSGTIQSAQTCWWTCLFRFIQPSFLLSFDHRMSKAGVPCQGGGSSGE